LLYIAAFGNIQWLNLSERRKTPIFDCKTIAICNQTVGMTKTTTTANLGIGLTFQGKSVLLVDIDPQANLTTAFNCLNIFTIPKEAHSSPFTYSFSYALAGQTSHFYLFSVPIVFPPGIFAKVVPVSREFLYNRYM